MKRYFMKFISLAIIILMLSSCADGKVLKTKDISTEITQTEVVIEDTYSQNEEFSDFLKDFSSDFVIPGLLEGVIPQGLCYVEKYDTYLISGYYEDGDFPSVVMQVDGKTGKFTKAHTLKNVDGSDFIGHAGGIACSEDYVFVTSESQCFVFKIDLLKSLKNKEALQFESNFKLNTKGSFATCYDGVLWTGDFVESDDEEREKAELITTLDSGETFYAYCEGYALKNGLPDVKKINSNKDGYIPDYFIAIPEQVQGMTFTTTGKIIFSTSYGRKNNSYLYVFEDIFLSDRVGTTTFDDVTLDIFACSSDLQTEKITMLPMAEGLTQGGDGVYVIFESGAAKYRNGGGKAPTHNAFKGVIE